MINNLPNKWKIEKLENISKIQAGGTPSRTKSEYWNGNIPWLKISNLKSKFTDKATEFITEEGLKNSSTKLFEENTILYTIFATLGEVSILKIKATTNQAIAGITITNSNVSLEYIYYYLKSIKEKVINEGRGVAQNNINLSILRNIEIPIPQLQQQEKIVKVLDLSSNLIEKQKELLKNYDLFLKSKFIEMFGDPIKNPMGFKIEKLGNVIKLDAKMVHPNIPEYENLLHIGPDRIEKNTGKLLPALTVKEEMLISKKFFFTNEYILYSKIRPYLNKVAMPNFSGLCSADMYPVKPIEEKVNRAYLWKLLLSTYFIKYTETLPDRASIPKLNKKELVEFSFPLPPIELQNKFASIVEKIETIKEKEKQKLKQLEDLHNSMMQKAFKGEI